MTKTAVDRADNAAAACHYAVIYDFLGAGGFRAPVNNRPVVNTVRSGSTIPVKWQLPDGLGGFLSDLSVVSAISAQQVSCLTFADALSDPVETTTAGSSGLHFDWTDMQYIYNWKTERSMGGRCFVLILSFDDGRSYQANFKFPR